MPQPSRFMLARLSIATLGLAAACDGGGAGGDSTGLAGASGLSRTWARSVQTVTWTVSVP